MVDFKKEETAYEMLRWVPYSFPADFDWEIAALGGYSKAQKERSDKAIDEWEKERPYITNPELQAFRELERLGIYTQNDFYSPQKAGNGFYTKRLAEHLDNIGGSKRTSRKVKIRSRKSRWLYN
tara:strand:+ start:839 stop:1210 length:372 start_codon:yes stop_codon:yes gene_type:complete